mmetsp:Transcript_21054/g.34830  ORF Transcript_21054/g.34830 Transcript_21054/m.34830 type:complete len:130 (+) Transcript_21054:214-603(+)|eukprot:CAMPEP_0119014534 /NCGR_PEP_ID=MMETSP1176-20130426/9906_1 /TAXON_ID=265551 /ORGANISM="Synedropsis recta cf, Strain CCMP1620" /LENGTH=129 /DNA_ID=CAMNT_0006967725 /DNA_START=123 /DNA_END=512 /DNA_ORIENTATION=-
MRGIVSLLLILPVVLGFQAAGGGLSRRDTLAQTGAAFAAGVITANAILQQLDDKNRSKNGRSMGSSSSEHQATDADKHGPYKTIQNFYIIPGVTQYDKKLFKKYQQYFTENPPGDDGVFKERINARVAT